MLRPKVDPVPNLFINRHLRPKVFEDLEARIQYMTTKPVFFFVFFFAHCFNPIQGNLELPLVE